MHKLFFFFNPQYGFLDWQNLLNTLWILTMVFALVLVFVYYLGFVFEVKSNRKVYFVVGWVGALVFAVGCLLYLIISKPIEDIAFLQAVNVVVHLFFWFFIGFFLLSLLRFILGPVFKHPKNGFLHKMNIPF